MYRVTTPTHTFTLPIDTSDCDQVQVTYQQGKNKLVFNSKDNPDEMFFDDKDVVVNLTQEETKTFKVGTVSVQVRVLTMSGQALASQKFKIKVTDVINDEILEPIETPEDDSGVILL